MSTLSLDLRGPGPSRYPSHTRGASVSLLIHGAGIAALVLLPLLGATEAPETADAIKTPLVKPITVSLPPIVPPTRSRTRAAGSQTAQAAGPASVPSDVPTLVSASDILDPGVSLPGDATGPGGGGGEGIAGVDCALGALCGPGPAQITESRHEPPRVGGAIQEPKLLESRAPQYPPIAQAAGVGGRVILEAHVGEDGRILDVKVLSGHALFDEAALISVRSRRYRPLLLNGVRSDFLVTITIIFNARR